MASRTRRDSACQTPRSRLFGVTDVFDGFVERMFILKVKGNTHSLVSGEGCGKFNLSAPTFNFHFQLGFTFYYSSSHNYLNQNGDRSPHSKLLLCVGPYTCYCESDAASARNSAAPSPRNALPCMQASVVGFASAKRSSICGPFFEWE